MSRPQDRRAFLGAVLADVLDLIPPLPGLDTIGSIVDAIQIQNEREAYPNQRVSTAIPLLETIDSPIPFIPSPLELLPSHVVGVIAAERARRRGKGIVPQEPDGRAPQPPVPPTPPRLPPLPLLPPLPGLRPRAQGPALPSTATMIALPPAAVLR